MKFVLKTEKEEIELKQYEVLSARLLDNTRGLLLAYQNALLSDPMVLMSHPELLEFLPKAGAKMTKAEEEANAFRIMSKLSQIAETKAPIGNNEGIDSIITLALGITDTRQLTTEQIEVINNYDNWKTLDVDIEEVVKYVQHFRSRVQQKGKTT